MSDRQEEREKGLYGGATPEEIALAVLRIGLVRRTSLGRRRESPSRRRRSHER